MIARFSFIVVNTSVIARRVAENRLAYINRNEDRAKREADYYKEKAAKTETLREA